MQRWTFTASLTVYAETENEARELCDACETDLEGAEIGDYAPPSLSVEDKEPESEEVED